MYHYLNANAVSKEKPNYLIKSLQNICKSKVKVLIKYWLGHMQYELT